MSEKRLYGIRGATGVENTATSITEEVGKMCSDIFTKNNIDPEDIVSIQFTMTDDITKLNAAAALRKSNCKTDVSQCALFCSKEPQLENSLPLMIRVLVTAYLPLNSRVEHVYQNRAEVLRPDFVKK